MRLLLTAQPIYSHLVPAVIPLARAAIEAGHQAAVATAASMSGLLAAHDVPHLVLPHLPDQESLRADPALGDAFGMPREVFAPGTRTVLPGVWEQIARAYAGPMADRAAADLIDLAGRWKPDVVVREPAEYGGYLAAQRLGIPHALLDIAPMAARDLPVVADLLATTPGPVRGHLHAGLVPQQWYPADLRTARARSYRLSPPVSRVDACCAALPGDRPLVVVSLGSLMLSLPGVDALLPTLVAALGRLGCTAVLSLGGRPELAALLPEPPGSVHVMPFIAQRALLATADLFVTHAGFGAVGEAIAAGVPMVALPLLADQPGNAGRCAELGLGLRLPADTATAGEIAGACATVLADPAYRWRAGAMQRRMLADPGLDALVADLARL
ncbi:glycosyltransferase [Actinoplanes sp. G11-F43]|uniref:glycosyltransferase n=1 Tax=Actinoplanes sp. G11-F43 TaxID=3424130 RepID=UPI003D3280FB